jgi:60 kDa SS-A/Ro ribonucleoprotein
MANKKLFTNKTPGKLVPEADTVNHAGGKAYQLSDKAALATYAVTGTLHDTFYVSAQDQLKDVIDLASKVEPIFIAKTAVYARTEGFMKDLPATLLSILLTRDTDLFEKTFPLVITNAKMLRSFMQLIRSGVFGRKSFGTVARRCIRKWFSNWTNPDALYNSSIGNDPSMKDVIRMVHPKPQTDQFSALFAYLLGKEYNDELLPKAVKEYEALKKSLQEGSAPLELPDINFQYLTSLPLTNDHWKHIAKTASWQTTRMNLNTFQRHEVFNDIELVDIVASRLKDEELIKKSNVFPYQLLAAYLNATDIPFDVKEALQDAMEIAVNNVPVIKGNTIVCLDTSGSMSSPVSGYRGNVTSKVTCMHVAALIAASIMRQNPRTTVIEFDTEASVVQLNPRDSIMTNADKLRRLCNGGTAVHSALSLIVEKKLPADTILVVSDNESWYNNSNNDRGTKEMQVWRAIQQQNKNVRCICLDITPNPSTPLQEGDNITNIAGFSDSVFDVIASIVNVGDKDAFVKTIEGVEI